MHKLSSIYRFTFKVVRWHYLTETLCNINGFLSKTSGVWKSKSKQILFVPQSFALSKLIAWIPLQNCKISEFMRIMIDKKLRCLLILIVWILMVHIFSTSHVQTWDSTEKPYLSTHVWNLLDVAVVEFWQTTKIWKMVFGQPMVVNGWPVIS